MKALTPSNHRLADAFRVYQPFSFYAEFGIVPRIVLVTTPIFLILYFYHLYAPSMNWPTFSEMGRSWMIYATEVEWDGKTQLVRDTTISLIRLAVGFAFGVVIGFFVGLHVGMIPIVRTSLIPIFIAAAMIPPAAMLPFLIPIFGVGETIKIVFIFLGIGLPFIAADTIRSAQQVPKDMIDSAMTFGASEIGVIYREVVPFMIPRLLRSMKMALGSGVTYLMFAEGLVADAGLGYSLYRYGQNFQMDFVIPILAYATVIAFVLDQLVALALRIKSKWEDIRA